ncbi:MAG: hypothetical protein RDU14_05245 [Melioribacteraceae bacterium]|nr:hypothetical protein [Melioribacteraceae bacterium]
MIKYESLNPSVFSPPGSFLEYLQHPCGNTRLSIEEAIFKEHRFAFYFWNKWGKRLNQNRDIELPPTLISIDWHTDLSAPDDDEQGELEQLNLDDDNEVALFCWLRLFCNNDRHIKSALYLNLLSDVIILQRQSDSYSRSYTDKFNNKHEIEIFSDHKKFYDFIMDKDYENVFLDIDLDYCVMNSGDIANASEAKTMLDEEIKQIFDIQNGLLSPLLNSIEGITIATEPDHCWGVLNSIHFLEVIEKTFFNSDLKWKHLGS